MAPPGMQRKAPYNAKGRAASLQQQGKKRKRQVYALEDDESAARARITADGADHLQASQVDLSNAEMIDPEETKRRKAERATKAAAEAAASTEKMSSKKKKRLDAYIKRKLKKEERVHLIASLAQTQTQSLDLRSSSALGSKQFKSQADRLAHAEQLEQGRVARKVDGSRRKRQRREYLSDEDDDDLDNEEIQDKSVTESEERVHVEGPAPTFQPYTRSDKTLHGQKPPPFNASGALEIVEVAQDATSSSSKPAGPLLPAPVVGSALKPGVTLTVVKRAKKEKGRMRAMAGMEPKGKGRPVDDEDDSASDADGESSGFDSSDSAHDEVEEADDESDSESWKGIDFEEDPPVPGEPDGQIGELSSDAEGNEEDDSDGDTENEGNTSTSTRAPRQKGSFQAWAEAQVLSAAGLEPSNRTTELEAADDPQASYKPLLPSGSGVPAAPLPDGLTGPLGAPLAKHELPTLPPQRSTNVPVSRTDEIQAQREQLPIVKEEDRIMDAIRGHAVVVICGETGSGKTTQIGQFLWEAGFGDKSSDNPGMVAVTQPRRVAALSTSKRVREELCLPADSSLVAHRIRYSSTSSADTKLVFMTDGVLLRELAADFLLTKYSVVVIDEAHERGVNTDVLIGVLSRVARLREDMWRKGQEGAKPLRLIIMSATLRVSDFAENPTLFPKPPPVLHVTARQHPVTMHFARRTHANYLEQAYKKVARIHARLPAGGVLVFCTGQNEIVSLVKKLEAKFGVKAVEARKRKVQLAKDRAMAKSGHGTKGWLLPLEGAGKGDDDEREESEADAQRGKVELGEDFEAEDIDLGADKNLASDVDDGIYDEDDEEGLESDEDEEKFGGLDMEEDTDEPLHVLPLYSLLPTERQMRVFADPPPGTRLVVVATNVAETAITIPNIRYVVDSGRAKERQFDVDSGIQSFEVQWISKASASQRAGRAGRTGPGHCYRLYSSAVFENYFDKHAKPEILRMPIEGVILQMKSMNIDAVANFPFPTPPDRDSLRRAEKTLVHLGALEASDSASKVGGKITELGRSMSLFPLSPRYSKMIVAGQQHGCLPYVIAIVCALSVGDPFLREQNLGDDDDALPELEGEKALSAAEIRHIRDPEIRRREELKVARKSFFQVQNKYALLGKGASDVFKMLSVVGAYEYDGGRDAFCEANFVRTKAMQEIHKLRAQISRIVQSTFQGIDAGFVPKLQPPNETQLKVLRQLMTSAFIDQVAIRKDIADKSSSLSYSKVASTRGVPYRSFGIDEDLFVHPSSTLFHQPPPEFIVYTELHRTHKVWLKTITKINSAWLPTLGRPLCTFSKPIETTSNAIANATASKSVNGDTRQTFVTPRFGSGVGIELKPIAVTQKLVSGRWVFV